MTASAAAMPQYRKNRIAHSFLSIRRTRALFPWTYNAQETDIVRRSLQAPQTRYLMQEERTTLTELAANSPYPIFQSGYFIARGEAIEGRLCVPLADPECHTDYRLVCLKEDLPKYRRLFDKVTEKTIARKSLRSLPCFIRAFRTPRPSQVRTIRSTSLRPALRRRGG